MTIYVSEHASDANPRQQGKAAIASYSLSSVTSTGGVSTGPFPQAGTKYIRVTADTGMYLSLNSTVSGATLSATNSFRIAPNAAGELFAVSTAFRVQAAST